MSIFRGALNFTVDKATRNSPPEAEDWVKACFGAAISWSYIFYFNFYTILFTDPNSSTFFIIAMQIVNTAVKIFQFLFFVS